MYIQHCTAEYTAEARSWVHDIWPMIAPYGPILFYLQIHARYMPKSTWIALCFVAVAVVYEARCWWRWRTNGTSQCFNRALIMVASLILLLIIFFYSAIVDVVVVFFYSAAAAAEYGTNMHCIFYITFANRNCCAEQQPPPPQQSTTWNETIWIGGALEAIAKLSLQILIVRIDERRTFNNLYIHQCETIANRISTDRFTHSLVSAHHSHRYTIRVNA